MLETITSLQNTRVKDAVRLRDRRARQQQNLTVIDGIREVERALIAKVPIRQAFILGECERPLSELIEQLGQSGARLSLVTDSVFDKLAFGNRSEGIVVTATPPNCSLDDFPKTGDALFAVIESVQKPGNIGAIVRSADAAGVSGMIVANPATDLFNPNTIRASLGAIFQMPICVTSSEFTKKWLIETETSVNVARVDGAINYVQADLTGRTAIVLGSEADGVSRAWHDHGMQAISLPMLGIADSLNVSATAAVLFYEALRQRSG